jgi:NAD(P)-dependent dehydrogenase (short-subunit alcohol dehydrogenase family)
MRTVVLTGASGNLGARWRRPSQATNARVAGLRPADERSSRQLLDAQSVQAAGADRSARPRRRAVQSRRRLPHGLAGARDQRQGLELPVQPERAHRAQHVARRGAGDAQGGGGKIVNVGAFAAQKGAAQMGAYIASKSAVIRLTETMAAELREQNINVNCVLPTIIDTPENRAAMPDGGSGRWVAPQDLAAVILFLASDAARAIHGAALPVTGLS